MQTSGQVKKMVANTCCKNKYQDPQRLAFATRIRLGKHARAYFITNNRKQIMKTTNYFFAIGILGLLFFSACKKTDNDLPVLTPKEKILSSTVWKMESIIIPAEADPTQDSLITAGCADSALYAFDMFKNFQIADPTGDCDSSIVSYDKGKWSLSAQDSLTLQGTRKMVWKINTLNDSTVIAHYRDSIAPDQVYQKTITLKK